VKYFNKALISLSNFIIGFLTTTNFPYILALALNRTHGNGNNPDGEMFVPFGIIFLLVLIIINVIAVLFDIGIIKRTCSRSDKIICVTVWLVGLILGYITHSFATGRWEYLSGLLKI